jgi:hypothetical protein
MTLMIRRLRALNPYLELNSDMAPESAPQHPNPREMTGSRDSRCNDTNAAPAAGGNVPSGGSSRSKLANVANAGYSYLTHNPVGELLSNTEDFKFALSLLRVDLMALCLSAGVNPTTLWPVEGLLLNLHVLQEFTFAKCRKMGVAQLATTNVGLYASPCYHRIGVVDHALPPGTATEETDTDADGYTLLVKLFSSVESYQTILHPIQTIPMGSGV